MPSFLVLTIVLPLICAVGIVGISLARRLRPYTPVIALAGCGLVTLLTVLLRWVNVAPTIPSLWYPSVLFGVTPVLYNDFVTQPLAFLLAFATFISVFVSAGRDELPLPRFLALILVLLSAGFIALWAATPLAMLIGWAIYDLALAAGHIAAGDGERTAMRGFILGSVASLLLWGGTLVVGDGQSSLLWSLMTPSQAQMTLWIAAAILRLGVYPFHLSNAAASRRTLPRTPLMMAPILGWALCLRIMMVNGGAFPSRPWVPAIAALSLVIGGFLAWSAPTPQVGLRWISSSVVSGILLGTILAGENGVPFMTVGCLAWGLGSTLLLPAGGLHWHAPWWSIPAMIGAWNLLGVPISLGFAFQSALLSGLFDASTMWWRGCFFLGTLFLVAAVGRSFIAAPVRPLPATWWRLAIYGVGLGLAVLLLLTAGFVPALLVPRSQLLSLGASFARPGVGGWLLWGGVLVGGGVLAWQDSRVRDRVSFLIHAGHDLLRLDWLYGAITGALERGLSVLRTVDEVVSGAGALLWSLLLFLLLLLIWSSR